MMDMENHIGSAQPSEFNNRKYLRNFVDDNAEYYLPRFAAFEAGGRKIRWNWPAFFFSATWVLFRKQYTLFAALWLVGIPFIFLPEPFYTVSQLVFMGFCGMFGNYLYYRHASRVVASCEGLVEEARQKRLERRGGTTGAVILAIAVIQLLLIIWF